MPIIQLHRRFINFVKQIIALFFQTTEAQASRSITFPDVGYYIVATCGRSTASAGDGSSSITDLVGCTVLNMNNSGTAIAQTFGQNIFMVSTNQPNATATIKCSTYHYDVAITKIQGYAYVGHKGNSDSGEDKNISQSYTKPTNADVTVACASILSPTSTSSLSVSGENKVLFNDGQLGMFSFEDENSHTLSSTIGSSTWVRSCWSFINFRKRQYSVPAGTLIYIDGNNNIINKAENTLVSSWYGSSLYTDGYYSGTKAMLFNHSNCIQIPFSEEIRFEDSDFTLATWFRIDIPHLNSRLYSHQNGKYSYRGFRMEFNSDSAGDLTVLVATSSSTDVTVGSITDVNIGEWTHYALVRSGNTLKCYINGVEKASNSISGSLYFNSSATFKIGAGAVESGDSTAPTNFFEGAVQDFILCRRALWTSNFTPPTSPGYKGL